MCSVLSVFKTHAISSYYVNIVLRALERICNSLSCLLKTFFAKYTQVNSHWTFPFTGGLKNSRREAEIFNSN